MRIGWIVIGVLITVGLFLFYPGIFDTLVRYVQSGIEYVSSWIASSNATNLTGAGK